MRNDITIITITPPEKGEFTNYEPARFIIKEDNGNIIIDSFSPSFGWLSNREDLNRTKLLQHVKTMQRQGFNVDFQIIESI